MVDSGHPGVPSLLVWSDLLLLMLMFVYVVGSGSTRYVGSGSTWDILDKGKTCQVNRGHVAVVVEDDGEGHLLCHLGQPGGGIVKVVVVAGFLSTCRQASCRS